MCLSLYSLEHATHVLSLSWEALSCEENLSKSLR